MNINSYINTLGAPDCPFCKQSSSWSVSALSAINVKYVRREILCNSCSNSWWEVFEMVGVVLPPQDLRYAVVDGVTLPLDSADWTPGAQPEITATVEMLRAKSPDWRRYSEDE